MRWQSAQDGDKRIRSGFLWFPHCAYHQKYRWLERATWVEHFDGYNWRITEWIDDEPIPYRITPAGREHLDGKA